MGKIARLLARPGVVPVPAPKVVAMRGSCGAFYRLVPDGWGPVLMCSRDRGHGGDHVALVRNVPLLGRLVAAWANNEAAGQGPPEEVTRGEIR